MPDLPDRFRALDQLEVPDIDARARALGPRPPTAPDGPSPAKRTTVIVLAFVVAVAGVGFLFRAFRQEATTAPGAAPPAELIAFSTIGNGVAGSKPAIGYSIAVVHPDGSGFRYVTQASADAPDLTTDPFIHRYSFASDDSPVWSPDGSTIAFVRHYAEGVDSLCMIGVDGSDFRVVVRDFHGAELAWSPDGSTFAFYSEQDGSVHLIDVNGTNERALHPRTGGLNQDTPSWSPDGRWIYYAAGDLYAVRADGSDAHRVVDLPWSASTAYISSDGSSFVVGRLRGGAARWTLLRLARPARWFEPRLLVKAPDGGWFAAGWSAAARVLVLKEMQRRVPELWMTPAYATGDRVRVDLPDGVAPYGSALRLVGARLSLPLRPVASTIAP